MTHPTQEIEPVRLSLSLDEARGVVWDSNKIFRRMGDLLDEGVLTERDLAWAALIAPNVRQRVREAARTILAHRLGLKSVQLDSIGQGPHVISGSKYLRSQERWSLGELFFILGLAAGAALVYTVFFVQEWAKGTITIPVLIVVGIMLFVIARMIHKQSTNSYREYQAFKQGGEGEDHVAERALANLDGKWTIFRNFVAANRKEDIDLILVGPAGILALEVKTYSAGTKLTLSSKKSMPWNRRSAQTNPSVEGQAAGNAASLKTLLSQRNCPIGWVEAVLVFADYRPVDFSATNPAVSVWSMAELDNKLVQLRNSNRLSEKEVDRYVAELTAMQK